jgi:helix-turn-helix protein
MIHWTSSHGGEMTEEQTLIENIRIQFISPVPDLQEKKINAQWLFGYITITNQKVILIPEKNNAANKSESISILITDITEVDRKIDLWRKILGTNRILPIHHTNNTNEVVSLIATSNETAMEIKNNLLILITSGETVDFVCPFSQGGKILFEKQPQKGSLVITKEIIELSAQWLGKKQIESIDIAKVDDTEMSSSATGQMSLVLKYQKDGILISTLITADGRIIKSLDKYIKIIKGISEEDEKEINLDEKQFMLLQMMYTSDIDAAMATEMLSITIDELEKLVQQLVHYKLLKATNEDEVELTEKGTKYIVEKMKQNIIRR